MKNTKTVAIDKPATIKETPEQRFRKQVASPDANGCQLWTGSAFHNGYGQFNTDGESVYAHRQAWAYANKVPLNTISSNAYVLHAVECTSRLCCAPGHLRLGNAKENAADRVKCGRSGLGVKVTRKTFTKEEKALIAKLHSEGKSQYRIAKLLNRSEPVISYQLKKNNEAIAAKLTAKAVSITSALSELSKTITDIYGEPETKKAA